jgi:hypothetical protein
MTAEIPISLELHLQDLGLLSQQLEELDNPIEEPKREFKFRTPNFDENGEPEF